MSIKRDEKRIDRESGWHFLHELRDMTGELLTRPVVVCLCDISRLGLVLDP